jgi:hypothetical protein
LKDAGLLDVWPQIKGALPDITSAVSSKAVALTLSALEKIARRFPTDSGWYAGLTVDRIDVMVRELKAKGVPSSTIERDIQGLVNAAGDATAGDEVAVDADVITYQNTGSITVVVDDSYAIRIYSAGDKIEYIQTRFLSAVIPGFDKTMTGVIETTFVDQDRVAFLWYFDDSSWSPTLPKEAANPGYRLKIKLNLLTQEEFVNNLQEINLANVEGVNWIADEAHLSDFSISDNQLSIRVAQTPVSDSSELTSFVLGGIVGKDFGRYNGYTTLDFFVKDIFGKTRTTHLQRRIPSIVARNHGRRPVQDGFDDLV